MHWSYRSIERYARLAHGGYASRDSAFQLPPSSRVYQKMESFLLSETLKYLYLLMGGDTASRSWPADQIVYNTGRCSLLLHPPSLACFHCCPYV